MHTLTTSAALRADRTPTAPFNAAASAGPASHGARTMARSRT